MRKKDLSEFLEQARAVHGDAYDYTGIDYVTMRTPIVIRCRVHGPFRQRPQKHVAGQGCRKCAEEQAADRCRSSATEFAEKARRVQGPFYDYSRVVYVNSKTKVSIGCPEHGFFEQQPDNHLLGQGCPVCRYLKSGTKKQKGFDAYVAEFRTIHGSKYDYDRSSFAGSQKPMRMICKEHGAFSMSPTNHMAGKGCRRCAGYTILNFEDFVAAAKAVHGGRYEYHATEYRGTMEKTRITCHMHGDFLQTPGHHLNERGCPQCGFAQRAMAQMKPFEQLVRDARRVHGMKYDYDEASYTGARKPMKIRCPDHGPFAQLPTNHLAGKGCPGCKASVGADRVARILEEAGIEFIREWTDHDCRDRRLVRFDFYVPASDLIIEFDGIQHYEVVEIFGGARALAENQRRDALKNAWAARSGYRLERIRFDDDIDARMAKILNFQS